MVRIKAGMLVTALVAAALAGVGALAVDAAGSAPGAAATAAARAARAGQALGKGVAAGGGAGRGAALWALPAHSGAGERVVYSIGLRRVWLVDDEERALRTYPVTGGGVRPALGTHQVFARRAQGRGGDGAPVEHVVLFASTDGTNIGFSAATDRAPHPPLRTAAIRQSRPDAAALWHQATIGSTVEVVR
ncbi:hypothetical protein [Actinacidiphila sp. ITFR-21]|uniref:hypothetical protein n=1 Tax=Actinacidiphila sp. ITFR-21 TaxID=3075199 RepID=UPI002889F765|nr:hypothetical protein [Streptomyces sp. ITFR-21]WNI17315.1 hypothetical protein RLT57_18525 [Streptomyces sp. ITFR-21]